ncbi:hypothetical protein [Streptomyces sp. Tue6028]|uniref:hypothetical protein n=1 Tax=Streptomyces sp. Tue6028 TaxID=2036037 RepID=UPI003D7396E7
MTPAGCHCADLPDASVVITRALLTARQNITDTVTARAMMCIDGGAGVGRTLAVNARLHEREPHETSARSPSVPGPPTAQCATSG